MSDSYHEQAVSALADRAYESAGDAYTRAGWAQLAEPRDGQNPFEPDSHGWVGRPLEWLVVAALAYRVAGRTQRATHRSVAAEAIARDLHAVFETPVQRACLLEYIGDCRVAGGLEGVEEAYETAAEAYREAGTDIETPEVWATTPLFEAVSGPIKQVARGRANGEIAATWETLHGPDPAQPGAFLAHRVRYKRQRFRGLLEGAVADGHLAAPRGTTAYGTDATCPRCGSADVNWVASLVLCLRCSTPTGQD